MRRSFAREISKALRRGLVVAFAPLLACTCTPVHTAAPAWTCAPDTRVCYTRMSLPPPCMRVRLSDSQARGPLRLSGAPGATTQHPREPWCWARTASQILRNTFHFQDACIEGASLVAFRPQRVRRVCRRHEPQETSSASGSDPVSICFWFANCKT
jgi:hypothetical protein